MIIRPFFPSRPTMVKRIKMKAIMTVHQSSEIEERNLFFDIRPPPFFSFYHHP
jgi:hypothetical protein